MGSISTSSFASDFQSPFVNVSDMGNAYGGWAALVPDASTAFTNPAGLTRIHHYQMVMPFIWLWGKARFDGTTTSPPFPFPFQIREAGDAKSRIRGITPSFYLSAPITDRITFAFGQTVPFGLGSNYGKYSLVRYLATKAKIGIIDVGPSVGFKVTDKFSVGAGFDAHYLMFILNQKLGPPVSIPFDSEIKNELTGWGYGWHAGVLYQFLPCFRIGASFNSKVWIHGKGDSTLLVPFPVALEFKSKRLRADAPLPPRAQLSFVYDINPCWSVMATTFYTHWAVLDKFTFRNHVTFGGGTTSVVIPLDYRDTFDYAAAINFKPTPKWILRTGVQILDTPLKPRFHSPANTGSSALVIAAGAHYEQDCHISYDIAYGHSFFDKAKIDIENLFAAAEGHVSAQSNAIGVQVNWNID